MARLGNFTKAPIEAKRYAVQYLDWLDTGEYVQSVTFGVTGSDSSLSVSSDAIAPSSTSLSFLVSGGTNGVTYTVSVTMTTTGSQVKQDTINYVVRNQ